MRRLRVLILGVCIPLAVAPDPTPADDPTATDPLEWLRAGTFLWNATGPWLTLNPEGLPSLPDNPWVAVKDPTLVHHEGRWHLFCSLRRKLGGAGRVRIGYLSFADWEDAPSAHWRLLELTDAYHGAPQVFHFGLHDKWYLIYQCEEPSRGFGIGPCYSTTERIDDPDSWSAPARAYEQKPAHVTSWLDFWVISDASRAFLFFTSLDGRMWRAETSLAEFPEGWSDPRVVLEGDVYEASHTYALAGTEGYLTLIEARTGSRRFYKAYLADRLDGEWTPVATTFGKPFAAPPNVFFSGTRWTDSISHGELIRTGIDQHLEVDPAELRFLFQGSSEADRRGKKWGAIPWRLGLLEAAPSSQ